MNRTESLRRRLVPRAEARAAENTAAGDFLSPLQLGRQEEAIRGCTHSDQRLLALRRERVNLVVAIGPGQMERFRRNAKSEEERQPTGLSKLAITPS